MKLNVHGMTCAHCEQAIKNAVATLGGAAEVDLNSGTVLITGTSDASAVRQVIEDAGYTVGDAVTSTPGKSCCASRP